MNFQKQHDGSYSSFLHLLLRSLLYFAISLSLFLPRGVVFSDSRDGEQINSAVRAMNDRLKFLENNRTLGSLPFPDNNYYSFRDLAPMLTANPTTQKEQEKVIIAYPKDSTLPIVLGVMSYKAGDTQPNLYVYLCEQRGGKTRLPVDISKSCRAGG